MPKYAYARAVHPRSKSARNLQSGASTPLKFHGRLRQLQDLVLLTGDDGEWTEGPNGVWRYRSEDGGGLNWSSTRGTLWFDGPPQPRARLRRIVEAAVQSRSNQPNPWF